MAAAPKIGIIKYGVGNVFSVSAGLRRAGADVEVVDAPSPGYDALVLPGVGAYGPAIERLEPHRRTLLDLLDDGVPVLGICLGMQLLFERSEEGGWREGLGLLPGEVVRLGARKLPHIGWSRIEVSRECRLLEGVERGSYFYFVHSYANLDTSRGFVCSTASHEGQRFVAAVESPPLYGTQFHPERSDGPGSTVLRNFVRIASGGRWLPQAYPDPPAARAQVGAMKGADLLGAIDFGKGGGLIPVVVQDAVSGEVLMLGYADRRAIELTLETGLAHFYSRSRRSLWMKGETSGNTLRVLEVTADCDLDSVLYLAVPSGNTCHTGKWSCFHNSMWDRPLMDVLWDLLRESLRAGPGASSLRSCDPPPDPLLLSLSAAVLLQGYDRRVADAAVVLGCQSAGLTMAQRLGLRAYASGAPRERRVVVLGGYYDEAAHERIAALEADHDVRLAAFVLADAGAPGLRRVRRVADLRSEGGRLLLRDPLGIRSAEI
ncbi:MAG: imidazole glycerol phosphate synthase subunit HisH [Nitrososphaeria archaeon]|jgi:glutamine amidotransferase